MQKEKAVLYGGAFDPPHNGHLHAAQWIVEHGIARKVFLIPCGQHPFDKQMALPEHRLAMTRLLETESIQVSDYEITQPNQTFSIDTLRYFSSAFPQFTYSWLIGADNLSAFKKWKEWETILQMFEVLVYPRITVPKPELLPGMILLNNAPLEPPSSTEIRTLIAEGKPFHHLVPVAVGDYISAHNLYNTDHA